LHYHARRFHAPLALAARIEVGRLLLSAMNDSHQAADLEARVRRIDLSGKALDETFLTATIPTDRSLAIGSLDGAATGTDALFVIDARQAGAADYDPSKRLVVFLDKPKRYRLPAATVRASAAGQPGTFTLTADQPAFFVKPEAQNFSGAFDDASFMLLPGESHTIAFRSFDGRVPEASDVTIRHLVAAYD
jgi:beta-mannosidase